MASRTKPSIAVIGAHAIVDPLRAAGYSVLAAGATDTPSVAAAAKAEAAAGRPFVVLVGLPSWDGGIDPATRAWLSVQVGAGRRVLGIVSDRAATTVEGIAGTRTLALPATVDELMANYGAPPVGGTVGTAVVGLDASVTPVGPKRQNREPEPEPEAPSEPEADPWEDESTGFDTSPVPIRPGVETYAPTTVTEAQVVPVRPTSSAQRLFSPAPAAQVAPDTSASPARRWDTAPSTFGSRRESRQPGWTAPEPGMTSTPPCLSATYSAASVHESGEPGSPPPRSKPPAHALLEAFDTPSPTSPSARAWETAEAGPARRRLAEVIVVLGGKGGVGKTTCAISIARRAASSGVNGFHRVALIDASRGQGDARKNLRVSGAGLPSIYDAALCGNPAAAICYPSELNAGRHAGLASLNFAVVLAPTDDQADPAVVGAPVYRRVIDYARANADLVVIDTQIVEAFDTSGLVDGLVVPLLGEDAWGLGIADQSAAGFDNLARRLYQFNEAGVNRSRIMVAFNRLRDSTVNDQTLRRAVAPYAAYVGSATNDPEVATALDLGHLPPRGPYHELIDAVLHRVTGLEVFAANPSTQFRAARKTRRWPLTLRR